MDNVDCNSSFRVLSIQSHVVSGYVGNKSACFPLQVLGFEVDLINSVQFSNHTGYKHIEGQRLNAEELQKLFDGLKRNDLTTAYTHILTGYVGTVTFLNKLVQIVEEIKKTVPSVYYVCDPVMGDNNQMYVPEELLPVYRERLIPLADLITPNLYETELLTGMTIKSERDVLEALDVFHKKGVETVVLSSVTFESSDKLKMYGSSVKGGTKSVVTMDIPILPATFTGTGDVFSALLLAWMAKTNGNLKVSCEKAVNTLHCILKRTLEFSKSTADPTSHFSLELKLIQSKREIENPPEIFKCHSL